MEFLKLSAEGSTGEVKDNAKFILTSPLVDEAHVYGREEDRKKILNQLEAEGGDGRTPVIPIVGMGGVGKTTLVQRIYNEDTLQFELKAWVTVGEDFNVLTVAKTILRQLDGINEEDFVSLQVRLKEILSQKKCLVVLDDMWTKDYANWNLFYKPFEKGFPGSRIIVTTRDEHVSLMVSRATGYPLGKLSDDDCLSIVAYHAFGRKHFNEHPHLKEVGEQIARKCDGLPLAVTALGGVLRGKENTSSWEELLNNKIWEEKETSVLPALKLSYYHLPPCLKLCFRYTAVFPKDYEFDKTRLVPLWIAEGFVQEMNDGCKYFDELLARSFFQKSSYNESLYVMHDLINDLARSISGNICLNLDEETEKPYAEVRHSAFTCREYDVHSRFERFHEVKHLRTFLALRHGRSLHWPCFISTMTLDVTTEKLKYLRVLALPYVIRQLPDSIGCLKHLRCLDISYAEIEMLPESLCKLLNLKVLILFVCTNLCRLPKDFCNLINLQFLDIRYTYKLKEMPSHISELKNLHIRGDIVVGESDVGRMLELLKIPYLQVRQRISALQNARNVEDVECWEMRKMEGIDALSLEWNDGSRNEKKEEEVLSALKPHKNIMELSINWYRGREWPSWIGDPLFGKMKILKICHCRNVESLPALGQLPSLEELIIEGMNGIKEVGKTFYGSVGSSAEVFPSLKILRIIKMEELYEWPNYSIDEDREHVFPKLKKLEIKSCPKLEVCRLSFLNLDELVVEGCKEVILRSISNLTSLTKLEINGISGLDESLNGSFLQALGSLQEMAVRDCNELKHLWDDEFNAERLESLKKLIICRCEELVSLVEEDEGNFPLNLQQLFVSNSHKLEKLPNQLRSLASLTDLEVSNCYKLETLSRRGLPYGLKRVSLAICDSLASLPEGIIEDNSMSQIEVLTILKCDALTLPAESSFPTSLRSLGIGSIPGKTLRPENDLPHLTSLTIQDCCYLESFPDTTTPIPTLVPTLLSLTLRSCKKLRSLPNHMNQFTSLKSLCMDDCPEVVFFPEEGLPVDLKGLSIAYCDEFASKVILEQSLKALASLQILTIKVRGGMDDISSFPHDSLLLPTTLTSLEISGFKNLKSISPWIRSLTSLQELSIGECPQLESLPKVGLPPSVGHLNIHLCPILQKRCREPKGDFWPLVASIPAWQRSDIVHVLRSLELRYDDFMTFHSKYRMEKYPWTKKTWY